MLKEIHNEPNYGVERCYDEYQKRAHSTAVHGGTFKYPFAAIAEEVGEVCAVVGQFWSELHTDTVKDYQEFQKKLKDECGDVMWNVAELSYLLGETLGTIVEEDPSRIDLDLWLPWLNQDDPSGIVHALVAMTGKLNGVWAKFIRKHNGAELKPEVDQPWLIEQFPDDQEAVTAFYEDCNNYLTAIAWLIRLLTNKYDIDFIDMLQHNLDKLAARKAKNTLGGQGSAERKE